MILLGFDPITVFTVVALNLAYQFFVHTQTVNKLGWFEKIFNTPSHHRVHHAINKGYLDKKLCRGAYYLVLSLRKKYQSHANTALLGS